MMPPLLRFRFFQRHCCFDADYIDFRFTPLSRFAADATTAAAIIVISIADADDYVPFAAAIATMPLY